MRLFFLLFLVLPLPLLSQQQFLATSVEDAKVLAAARGTFVVLDFYADWCGPCKTMDSKVWAREDVATAQAPFVNVRIDASYDQTPLRRYQLTAIPALLIIDAFGNEYYRGIGTLSHSQVITVLQDFPQEMQAAYAAESSMQEQEEVFDPHFLVGRNYQSVARRASGLVATKLARRSTEALEQALDILRTHETTPADLEERIGIMLAENLILRGRAKKALKLMADYRNLDPKNEALGCYVRSLAYRETSQTAKAEECYTALQAAADNEKYLALYEAARRE